MKTDTTKLSITLSPEILSKIDKANYNRNKLIVNLLHNFVDKNKK